MNIKLLKTYKGHKDAIYKLIRLDENHFLSGSGDGLLVKWPITGKTGPESIAKAAGGIYSIALLDDARLAIGTNNGHLHIIDYQSKLLVKNLKLGKAKTPIFDLKVSPKQKSLFAATGNGEVIIIDMESLTVLQSHQISQKNVRSLDMNSSESMLIAAGSDHNAYVLSIPEFHLIRTLKGHENSIFCSVFMSETGVLTGARDAHLKHWEVIEGVETNSIPAHNFTINEIAISPSNSHFVTVSRDKSIKFWDLENLKLLKVLERNKGIDTHTHSVNTVLWLENTVITGGDDRRIILWTVA